MRQLRRRCRGQSVTEYALLVCLVFAVSLPVVRILTRHTDDAVNHALDVYSASALGPGEVVGNAFDSPPSGPESYGDGAPSWPSGN